MQKWKTYMDTAFKACHVDPNIGVPPIRMTYRAMDANGNLQDFDNQTNANNFAGKPKHVIKNQDDVQAQKDWVTSHQLVENYAAERWYNDLRQENSHLNDRTFELIYSKAWGDGHSHGRDYVVEEFDTIADFINDIIAANK